MKRAKSKLVVRELTEDTQLDQEQMEKVCGGLGYLFSDETLKSLGKEDLAKKRQAWDANMSHTGC